MITHAYIHTQTNKQAKTQTSTYNTNQLKKTRFPKNENRKKDPHTIVPPDRIPNDLSEPICGSLWKSGITVSMFLASPQSVPNSNGLIVPASGVLASDRTWLSAAFDARLRAESESRTAFCAIADTS